MKINRIIACSFLLCSISFSISAQESKQHAETIHWMSIQEALQLSKTTPKKVFLDVYTNWCGWCKKMDVSTFDDPEVVGYVNAHFYPVKFNAETHDTIQYLDKSYLYKPDYRANELAALFLNGQMSYPTSVYLDEKSNLIGPVPGYLDAKQFLVVIKYFGEDTYKSKKWEDYIRENFK